MGTLREGLYTFVIISDFDLSMRNILDECCRENYDVQKHFQEIVPFKRERGKVWYGQRDHALCMLNN
jgi:hypothetical protein